MYIYTLPMYLLRVFYVYRANELDLCRNNFVTKKWEWDCKNEIVQETSQSAKRRQEMESREKGGSLEPYLTTLSHHLTYT